MLNCESCRERLFDLVYGLLESKDFEETQAHVETCAECQAALAKIKTSQKLIARAAKAISQVPEFRLPADPSEAPTLLAPPEMNSGVRKKGGLWRRPWLVGAIAAAVLIAVLSPVVWYREKVHVYQSGVADARQAYRAIDLELAALPAKYRPELEQAARKAREQADPYLHVVGPKTLEPSAKGHLDITTRHPEGELAACTLRIKKTLETDKGSVVLVDRVTSEGHVRISIDAAGAKPATKMTLLIDAETKYGVARVAEQVNVPVPTYVSRIDTSKALYRSHDVLFFRALVLDRVTLQPPSTPIALRVSLMYEGKPVRRLDQLTGAGGILAAEFAVEEMYPEGSYTLEVQATDATKIQLQTSTARVEIVHDLPGIRLDEMRYARGNRVTGDLMLPSYAAAPKNIVGKLDGKPIPIAISPVPPPSAPAVGGGGRGGGIGGGFGGAGGPAVNKDAKDSFRAFRFETPPIPQSAGRNGDQARLIVPIPEAKKEFGAVIPLEPTDFIIDFFPEGGDLIAGVQNRLFYRVRSKSGAPVTGDGQVILLTGKNEVVDSSYRLGMGYLDFTPDLKESYSVRITTPAKVENLARPFEHLGIRTSGVVLQVADPSDDHAPRAVGKQGAPIHVTLRRQGPAVKLLLVAHCRGQIVDQRWVEVNKEPVDVTLQPTPDAQGMIRVTAMEVVGDTLTPVAERLVYRTPAQRLALTFMPDRDRFQPNQRTTAKITARDENGQPAPTWLLASVVDERFQARPQSLSAHFLLFNEVRSGADLENATIAVHDSPKSIEVLELFLGTHGWRRYVAAPAPGIIPAGNGAAPALVFSSESMPLEALQKRHEEKIGAAQTRIRTDALKEQARLEGERTRLGVAVNVLVDQAYHFETQIQLWFRLGLGFALASLLAFSLLVMSYGAYRILRARQSATPAFVTAFVCLAACLAIYLGGQSLGRLDEAAPAAIAHAEEKNQQDRFALLDRLADRHAPAAVVRQQPIGEFFLRADRAALEQQHVLPLVQQKNADLAKHESSKAAEGAVVANAMRDRDALANSALRRMQAPEDVKLLQEWFRNAQGQANVVAQPSGAPKDKKKEFGKGKVAPTPAAARRLEYPYQPSPSALGDTLLWHPNLYLNDGAGEVRFDIAPVQATYRVLLLGHSPTGRFGFFETRFDVPTIVDR